MKLKPLIHPQVFLPFALLSALIASSASIALAEPTAAAAAAAAPDLSWIPGNYGPPESKLASKYFTPELRLDSSYHYSFNNPSDNTISGSSEVFRHNEVHNTQIGVGGDFSYNDVGFRLMTQFGLYATGTPRNDPSTARGQWDLANSYRYISEAYATYHLNALSGINIQAGLFMSYVGLWSYYNFDNWTYQPSYVSSNTPWYFDGVRVQIFTSDKLKIEPWIVNGWQSYGKFNTGPGLGLQVSWRPTDSLAVLGNQYYGTDTLANGDRKRFHTDDSVMVKYYENQGRTISKAAASLTFDGGCEDGGGVRCGQQYFLGFMAYNRLWFSHDTYGLTVGGGAIRNPGRYLVLTPPINGATSYSGAPSYFTANPGDDFMAWDFQVTGDYMPTRNLTLRLEFNHRASSVPYFSGAGGVTPPGGNQGAPGSAVSGWSPDLATSENRLTAAMLVRL